MNYQPPRPVLLQLQRYAATIERSGLNFEVYYHDSFGVKHETSFSVENAICQEDMDMAWVACCRALGLPAEDLYQDPTE